MVRLTFSTDCVFWTAVSVFAGVTNGVGVIVGVGETGVSTLLVIAGCEIVVTGVFVTVSGLVHPVSVIAEIRSMQNHAYDKRSLCCVAMIINT